MLLYSTGPIMLQGSAVSGPVFSFWRLWIGAAFLTTLGVVTTLVGGRPVTTKASGWRWQVIAGVFFGIHQLMFMSAVKMTTVVDVALMNALAPIVTAIGAWWLFSERPGKGFYAWSLLAIAGGGYLALGASAGPSGNAGGMVLAVLNVVFFAGFFLASKSSRDSIAVVPFLAGVMVVAAIVVTIFVLVAKVPVGSVRSTDLLLAACVALGPGALGHFVMTWPLRWVPANIPPVMRLAQPALSGVLAFAVLGERLTLTHLIGGLIIVAGAAGAINSRAGKGLRNAAQEQPAQTVDNSLRTSRALRTPTGKPAVSTTTR
ncbi:hypothetical protein BH24ACT15_BH24ACT15_16250 [soil metagenome]